LFFSSNATLPSDIRDSRPWAIGGLNWYLNSRSNLLDATFIRGHEGRGQDAARRRKPRGLSN
jgi:hypothetical protein